ncbi:MAG: type II secretion system protein [Idiomarina sp.]|nr:type II secretion system protein [Idiomarina sp.]
MRARLQGFTLVELIVVIVLLAIVGTFSFAYLGFGARIFVDTVERDQLVTQSRFSVERLSREVRASLPRSQRVNVTDNQRCLEFVPLLASSSYVQAPRPGPTASADFIGITPVVDTNVTLLDQYLFVYASNLPQIYGTSTRRKQIDDLQADTPEVGLTTFTYSDTPAFFPTESPARRYFIGALPVSWCVQGAPPNQTLVRYSNYGFFTEQPTLAALQASGTGEVMASQLANALNNPDEYPFRVFDATLQRNNLVQFDFRFARADGEPLIIQHEVHVPNVP